MSLDQQESTPGARAVVSEADAMRSALGSVRAEGLEPDAAGIALIEAVTAGELTIDEAIEQALALYAA